ncbi:hypothetical protein [Thermoplasma sp. Kam2015]|nr:hypothetical protein [Thermoplasma sp. Kam2015]
MGETANLNSFSDEIHGLSSIEIININSARLMRMELGRLEHQTIDSTI